MSNKTKSEAKEDFVLKAFWELALMSTLSPYLSSPSSFCLFSELPVKEWSWEARRPGIRFPLNYLARENKKGYIMRKSPTGSLSSVEDMESSVLPMRGIRKVKRELGKILFLHPLLQSSPQTLLGFLLEFSTKYNSSHAKTIIFMSCLALCSHLALALRW